VKERSVTHSTFTIERSYPSQPDRVFAAFADPAKKRRWFAEGERGHIEEFTMDFRIGGRERTRSRFAEGSPFSGTALTNDTIYQDIVPNQRIVMAYTMTLGEKRISSSQATVEFLPAEKGTDLLFTEQAAFFPGADGARIREEGWRELLQQLATELERPGPR
jgi:uncharacterized protein YndB with AHSA1/START domain